MCAGAKAPKRERMNGNICDLICDGLDHKVTVTGVFLSLELELKTRPWRTERRERESI